MSQRSFKDLFRTEHSISNRIFGLDLLRFIAIVMVVLGHGCVVLPDKLAQDIQRFMLDGVSIFFVLSGFLIGGILIRQLEKGRDTWSDLVHFWKRRWMRTLPAYVFILTFILLYTLIVTPKVFPWHNWYKFYLFVQNLFQPRPQFFGEAWSLSVEEWFYLTVPLLIFGCIILFRMRPKVIVPVVVVLIIIAVTIYRHVLYGRLVLQQGEFDSFRAYSSYGHELITYRVIPRLDSLMYGVLGAYIMYYFPKSWKLETGVRLILFFAGLIMLYAIKRNNAEDYVLYDAVWSHTVKSVAVLLMLPFLSQLRVEPNSVTRFITFISLISYSMYLVNWKVVLLIIMKNGIYQQYTGRWEAHDHWPVDYAIFWAITIGLSYALYRLVETPFMNLRKAD